MRDQLPAAVQPRHRRRVEIRGAVLRREAGAEEVVGVDDDAGVAALLGPAGGGDLEAGDIARGIRTGDVGRGAEAQGSMELGEGGANRSDGGKSEDLSQEAVDRDARILPVLLRADEVEAYGNAIARQS